MSNSYKIKITKIFSPCEFYFHFAEGHFKKQQDDARNQVAHIEKRIRHEVSKNDPAKDATVGQIVTCFVQNWNKWVRARVLTHYHNGDYEVLVIDYGYKMDMKRVYNIPEEFTEDYHLVKKGSLGISPAEYWSDSIMNMCKELQNKRGLELRFILICKQEDLYIGDIFVLSQTGNYSLTERLKDSANVTCESDFKKIFETLSKASLPRESHPQERIEVPSKQLDLASISQILLHQNNFIPPPSLVIHGEHLKAQWKDVKETLFDSSIKKGIKTKLTDIQSFMWPQMHSSFRHALIISSQLDHTSLYLPVLLNNVIRSPSCRAKPEFMGPVALILAHNSSKADEIAKTCENTVRNLKVIKATGLCDDKKGEIINGCDILVTTPPAFSRLTNNVSLKIIDVNRLKHVAFDGYHQISSKFESDVNRILKFCMCDSEKVPQIIVTSGMFKAEIRQKFLNQLPRERTVVCIDSFIEAAVYAGIEINVEICDTFDKKIEILMKDGNLNNALIIAKDEEVGKLKDILSSIKEKVSVTTDSSLDSSNTKSIGNLIHFSAAKNWKTFVKRFETMSTKISDKLYGKDVKLTATVLFDEQDIAEFESLMTFMMDRKLFKGNPQLLEKIRQNREASKFTKNIKLCGKLLQFGECNDQYCANRHVLLASDKYIDTFNNNYVKFNLVSTVSPIEFTIKVREYCKNGQWVSLLEEREAIERKLGDEFQKYCENEGVNLKIQEGTIGEIYAKYDANEKRWVRGKVVERNSPTILKLYLIDQCDNTHALESQLIKIPPVFASLRPLMHKLRIINLIPLDGDLNYSNSDTEKLQKEINGIREKSTFTCKVQMSFNDMLFADNIEAKNSKNVVKFRLKHTLLKLGLSEFDENVGTELKKLLGIESKVTNNPSSVEIQEKLITQVKEKLPIVEMWKELKVGETYSVTFSHYISPYSFFITIDSSENFVLKKWMRTFEEFTNNKSLHDPHVGSACLVNHNGVNKRAKIMSITADDDDAQILLVDFGEIVTLKISSLYELPEEFKEFRYQAVHCSLYGIKPKFNMKFWPSMQKSGINNFINDREWSLKVVGKNPKQHDFSDLKVNSYEVLLFDEDQYFHETIINKFYACADESVKLINDDENNEEESSDESCDALTFESESDSTNNLRTESGYRTNDTESSNEDLPSFNLEGFKTMLEFCQKSVDAELESTEKIKTIAKKVESSEDIKSSRLTSLFKHPYVEWRQNHVQIYILVSAKDCIDYSIDLNECTADITLVFPGNKTERAVLQLYGLIKVNLCSQHFNGSNLILRLAKRAVNREWPRLTHDKPFSTYVKFSDENVPDISCIEAITQTGICYPPDLDSDDDCESDSNENSKCISSEDDD